jgi:hypothetical protein
MRKCVEIMEREFGLDLENKIMSPLSHSCMYMYVYVQTIPIPIMCVQVFSIIMHSGLLNSILRLAISDYTTITHLSSSFLISLRLASPWAGFWVLVGSLGAKRRKEVEVKISISTFRSYKELPVIPFPLPHCLL